MSVGDCYDVRKDQMSLAAGLVSCDAKHDDEVYAVYELESDATYPESVSALFDAPFNGCVERFEGFIGISYESSVLEVSPHVTTTDRWATGDRRVWCLVSHPGDTLTSSLAGAGY